MKNLIIQTPAKINFGLHVLEQRLDNYHNIETIFYPINLYDTLTFEASTHFEFFTDSKELNENKFNLVVEAKDLLQNYTNKNFNVRITLEKKIPIGGGMGGGSSDAAATLKGLIQFYGLHIEDELLKIIALQLGSDVPFFLNPVPSLGIARGDRLIPLKNFHINFFILIVNPNINIPTKWAFGGLELIEHEFSLKNLSDDIWSNTKKMRSLIRNDFERKVFRKFPVLSQIKKNLYSLDAQYVLMTGTGSTIFALFNNEDEAVNAKRILAENYFTHLEPPGNISLQHFQ